MKHRSKCHPEKFELYSARTARPWERGLCAVCVNKANKTLAVSRARVRERLDRNERASAKALAKAGASAARQGRARFCTSAGVSLNQWFELVQAVGAACVYCRKQTPNLSISYLVPLKRGGKDIRDNVLPACPQCIHRKGRRLLTEWADGQAMLNIETLTLLEARTEKILELSK